jgi:N-methylhydantoinase A/oxoprolinase/acetone carboxylase beta subunit
MMPGMTFKGPAIVEEDTTTVLVGPHDTCKVDSFGNYVIEMQHER